MRGPPGVSDGSEIRTLVPTEHDRLPARGRRPTADSDLAPGPVAFELGNAFERSLRRRVGRRDLAPDGLEGCPASVPKGRLGVATLERVCLACSGASACEFVQGRLHLRGEPWIADSSLDALQGATPSHLLVHARSQRTRPATRPGTATAALCRGSAQRARYRVILGHHRGSRRGGFATRYLTLSFFGCALLTKSNTLSTRLAASVTAAGAIST